MDMPINSFDSFDTKVYQMDTIMYILILSALACIIIAIVLYFLYHMVLKFAHQLEQMLQNPFSNCFCPENIDKALESLVNNPKYQNFLVASGNFIGVGAKNGVGGILGGGGRMSIEKLVKEALGGWIQQRVNTLQPQNNVLVDVTPNATPQTSNTDMKIS
jgi:hypothetical protein